ncbi:hybrid sensor histidine kinase/response regulator [Synechocystis sp. PCC 7339]|uniref:hybrid sensor histidine kinase/response regulator n=1 Tax=unclassified Synechocystis TaxID=2640012 RepID=UPI001BB0618D|nr:MULTISPECIES: hybrid sensor histidine kinase/response regulator [unclassified Synechocystis]QUS59295.1 hybrid sensor histidine kinase/response regulator [Synechocystis sp. PCC 7338]UAJ71482.1 hybrid sensor histidine kinase/response regulator [Synechocystis sp. PCC 7339]
MSVISPCLRILLIEDNPAEARLLQEILKGSPTENFEFKHVQRLGDALAILDRGDKFDIILLDLTLPDSQGLDSLPKLQKHQQQLPVIVLTHHQDEALALEAVRQGAQDYLVKRDVSLDVLLRSVHYAIQRHCLARELAVENQTLNANLKRQERELSEAKAANKLKSEFVSMLSHDFRNPLNTILLSAGLLEESGDRLSKGQQHNYFNMIRTAIKDLDELLSEVLLLGKTENGQLSCQFEALDLLYFCQDLMRLVNSAQRQPRPIHFHTKGNLQQGVWDAHLLRHIICNLLSNAIKYSPAPTPILFDVIAKDKTMIFRVADQGIGIPPQAMAELFNPFFRADNVEGVTGTGLGLAIVQRCANIHGGEVKVESKEGEGSCFTVRLPILEMDDNGDRVSS